MTDDPQPLNTMVKGVELSPFELGEPLRNNATEPAQVRLERGVRP